MTRARRTFISSTIAKLLCRVSWSAYLAYHLRGQTRFPFRSLDAIRRAQRRRVRAMVAHAYRTVPYYRETMDRLALRPYDVRDAADLARLPLIEREQLQRDPQYFVSTAQPLDRYLRVRSGGSSGEPRTVYHDASALFQSAAHGERERRIVTRLVGKTLGYRMTVIAPPFSTDYEVQRFYLDRGFFPRGLAVRRQYVSVLDPPRQAVSSINAFRPDVIHSYGSYLTMLFAYLQREGVPFHRPKVITYSSDGLPDGTRAAIEQRFGIPVLSTYEAIEAFKIGFECDHHRGLHLNVDLYPVSIIDAQGRPVPAGESGDLIVSNLVNRATVLLNYRLGDVCAVSPERCSCGRYLPLLSFPPGRSDDLIELPSGQLIHPQVVRTIFTDEDQIWQYQVVQHTDTHFSVSAVPGEGCDRPRARERIITKFARAFGTETTVEVAFVEAIDRTAAGKFRPVLSLRQRARLGPGSGGANTGLPGRAG